VSTPVLATKLFAPTRRPQLVARSRLIEQLDATLDPGHRLTLLSAPAGFGKTTVLGDWLAHIDQLEDHPRVGWLSLDEGDNDLVRLLTHLTAALRGAGLEVDEGVVQSLQPGSASPALTAIVNEVALAGELTPGERWVLVLDDYHVISAPDVHEAVIFLLDHLPDLLHLVIATRSDPPLSLPRLRARGQLTEVRAADLRFNTAEAQEFLNQAMGLELSPADIDALDERTEGWVAGLQLAALSLQATR
jgi:LuxR family maltose regulon positive regulatory protein